MAQRPDVGVLGTELQSLIPLLKYSAGALLSRNSSGVQTRFPICQLHLRLAGTPLLKSIL